MLKNGLQLNVSISEAHREALKRVAGMVYSSEGQVIRDLIVFADQVAAGGCPAFPDWLKQAQEVALEAKGEAMPEPAAVVARPALSEVAMPAIAPAKDAKEQEAFALANGFSIACQDGPCKSCQGDCDEGMWSIRETDGDELACGMHRSDAAWIAYALALSHLARPPLAVLPRHPRHDRAEPPAEPAPAALERQAASPKVEAQPAPQKAAALPAPPVARPASPAPTMPAAPPPAQVAPPQARQTSAGVDAKGKPFVKWLGYTMPVDMEVYRMVIAGDKRNPALLQLAYTLKENPEAIRPADIEKPIRYLFPEWSDAFKALDQGR